MTFLEVMWMGESVGDGADLDEAIEAYRELLPEGLSWAEVCASDTYAPSIRRYASFDAYLDNEDALETIQVTSAMVEAAALGWNQDPLPSPS